MPDALFSPQVSPLVIRDQGNRNGEQFALDGLYLLTLEGFDVSSQVLHHTMAAPGFYLARSGVVQKEYHPDNRPLHRHGCLELMYVISGEVTQYVESSRRVYAPGHCCVLNKNIYHVESYSSDFEAVFLMLSDEFLQQVMEQDLHVPHFSDYRTSSNPLYQEVQRLLGNEAHKQYLEFAPLAEAGESGGIRKLLMDILAETREQRPGFLPIVSGYMARLLDRLADPGLYQFHLAELQGTREDFIYSGIQRYLCGSRGRVDYDELERMLHYTRDYLNRIVHRRSGMSMVEFGRQLSMEEAARLLAQTDMSVGEIMHSLRYANRTYFYRIFREKYGMTPKAYRSSNKR